MATRAPGLTAQLAEAYAEFAESDAQLSQKRADLVAREAALKARQQALQQRKALLLAEKSEKARDSASLEVDGHREAVLETPCGDGQISAQLAKVDALLKGVSPSGVDTVPVAGIR